ncbi:MAG: fibronectin type III domain-containing protein [Clostridia bacterium]|nr:fibronectin type III domain-containing protein [Clostridia bacterium]
MKRFKKLLAVVLTLCLCAAVIPFSALTVSAETVKIGYIFKTDVNMREDATTASKAVAKLSNWTVTVVGSKNDTAGAINEKTGKPYVWYNVSYISESNTVKGYVREDLIEVKNYTLDKSFAKKLADFPESYHAPLIQLHAIYPNWVFTADKVGQSFSSAVAAQDKKFTKLISTSYNSLRSMREGCYDWSKKQFIKTDTGKYGASRELIAYYMDPRNFLNANDIYVFMQQSFDPKTQTREGVKEIVDGTYLDARITDENDKNYDKEEKKGKTYSSVIMQAAKESNVNPYVLASTLILEQSRKGTVLTQGTKYKDTTVYNFFNYGANGSNKDEVLKNAKKYAYNQNWNTPTQAIVGGAIKYGSGYIAIGQDTYYYKNYNVLNPNKLWHQYAQSVTDSLSSSRFLKANYAGNKDLKVVFRIPVFESMSNSVSKYPVKNDTLNNYYFSSIKIDGLSPSFSRDTENYTLSIDKDMDIYIEVPSTASFTGPYSFDLKKGQNKIKLKLKAQSGVSRTYTITVNASKDAVIKIKQMGGTLVQEADGNYYYYINGEKSTDTTLVKYNGSYHYVKKGVFTKTTTFVKYLNKYYYVKNGIWSKETKFVKYKDKYYYVKGGIRSADTKFVKYNDKYYKLKKGVRVSKDTYQKYNGVYLRLSTKEFEYTGKSRKPSVKIYDSKGNALSKKYYTVSYAYGRKYVGKYKVTVRLRGKYSGTKKLYFKIVPKATKVSKLSSAKKSLTVKIKKQSVQVKGYEVQYSTFEDFQNAKTKTIKNYRTSSVTLKKLKAKTYYYVRVRTYKTVNGTKYYSDWSDYKRKKTK